MNVQAAIVRVHINDDDSCDKLCEMRIGNNGKKNKKDQKLKCAPRESGSCGTFGTVREEASWPWNNISGAAQCPFCVLSSRRRGRHPPAEAQRTMLSTSTEAVTFLHLVATFFSHQLSSSGSGCVVLSPYDTPHNADPPTPAPLLSGEAHDSLDSPPGPEGEEGPPGTTYCCVPVGCPVLRACVRACVRE